MVWIGQKLNPAVLVMGSLPGTPPSQRASKLPRREAGDVLAGFGGRERAFQAMREGVVWSGGIRLLKSPTEGAAMHWFQVASTALDCRI